MKASAGIVFFIGLFFIVLISLTTANILEFTFFLEMPTIQGLLILWIFVLLIYISIVELFQIEELEKKVNKK